jgi:homoserine O-acetyltransferase
MSDYRIFESPVPFTLESGVTLPGYHLAYHTYGHLNEQGDNAVWIFHALTANSDAQSWWPGLVGPGRLFDPARYFIVCVNMPGSCYGSIGPLEKKPGSEELYYHDFPFFPIHDMVKAYQPLRRQLGINRIHIGIGGSMGGQQLLEWAVQEPTLFEYIVPIATNAWHSAWGKAFNASQRWCIEADLTWQQASPEAGIAGMKVARSVALLSYRHYETYQLFQSDEEAERLDSYKAGSYQQHQGEKLAKRFNAFSYHRLSSSMDSHHIGRGRTNAATALQAITAQALVIGIATDILFPLTEQEYLARWIPGAKLAVISSRYGHDGFLLEFEGIEKEIRTFLINRPLKNQDKDVPVQLVTGE